MLNLVVRKETDRFEKVKHIELEGFDWINLAQGRKKWWSVVITAKNFQVS
jgi:hypothetical protein